MTLQRLPDTPPTEWLGDFTQVMETHDWYGFEAFGPTYGNFWPARPCKRVDHKWLVLRTERHSDPREVRRCQRCGAQVYQLWSVVPPARGIL